MSDEYPGYRVGVAAMNSDYGITLMVCERCGAVVGSIPDHDAWHEPVIRRVKA